MSFLFTERPDVWCNSHVSMDVSMAWFEVPGSDDHLNLMALLAYGYYMGS